MTGQLLRDELYYTGLNRLKSNV